MFKTLAHLLSLIRFSHTLFALPFALMAAVMAWWLRAIEENPTLDLTPDGYYQQFSFGGSTYPIPFGIPIYLERPTIEERLHALLHVIRWQELLGILLCMVFARSAAMAFNRLADRKIDAENPRTAGRHLPAGILSVTKVTLFAIACATAFVSSTLLFLPNLLPLYLSVPVLLFLCGYSYCKRFTSLAHFWLGAALAMSPVAAWVAIRGEAMIQHPGDLVPPLVLGGAVLA
ncbi:MAG: UbiA family prenyltransferase, partial [Aeoliella sp.]